MWKEHKKTIILTCIVLLLPIVAGVILWDKLPEQVPTHFDSKGQVNGWSSKAFAVFGLPLILMGAQVVMVGATLADPKKKNMNGKVFAVILWMMPVLSIFAHIVTYGSALGYEMNVAKGCMLLMGLLYLLVGNYLPKCKQNFTLGLKLPWTLNDGDNWNKTHRVAGFLWVIGGAVIMFSAIGESYEILMIVSAVIFVVPVGYSFMHYLKYGKKQENE